MFTFSPSIWSRVRLAIFMFGPKSSSRVWLDRVGEGVNVFFSSNDVERGKVREKSAQIIVLLTMSITMGTDLRATISIFLAFTSASFSADFIFYTLPFAVVLIQSLHNTYLKRIYVRICVTYIYIYIYTYIYVYIHTYTRSSAEMARWGEKLIFYQISSTCSKFWQEKFIRLIV